MPLTRGQRLVRLRRQKGVEQRAAADSIGVGAPYLSLLENDKKGRSVDRVRPVLGKAAEYYGVMAEYLLAESPQQYIAAFVRELETLPPTFGGRLAIVLEELQLRWGEEFGLDRVAMRMGTTADVLNGYMSDTVSVTDSAAEQLSAVTGAPLKWLVPRQGSPPDPAAPFQHAVRLAVENGMQPNELETLIQVWLAAQQKIGPRGKTP
jgi:transcriptional regulator with XRE-family HTH domain